MGLAQAPEEAAGATDRWYRGNAPERRRVRATSTWVSTLVAVGLAAAALAQSPSGPADRRGDPAAPVAGGEAGHGSVTVQLGLYHQADDGDANPFLDEELTVIEPAVPSQTWTCPLRRQNVHITRRVMCGANLATSDGLMGKAIVARRR